MDSKLEPGIEDILLRSRHTILDILDDRGYNTTNYRNISPEQILTLAEGVSSRALDIVVPASTASTTSSAIAVARRAVVIYTLQQRIRSKITTGTFFNELFTEESALPTKEDDDIIIINEPYNDTFDKASLKQWQSKKIRICFFHIKQMVVHLGRHVLVPRHRKLTEEEATKEIERLQITQKSQFPLIKHSDIQARILGLVPGDLVEIMRPSPTSGVNRVLRICAA